MQNSRPPMHSALDNNSLLSKRYTDYVMIAGCRPDPNIICGRAPNQGSSIIETTLVEAKATISTLAEQKKHKPCPIPFYLEQNPTENASIDPCRIAYHFPKISREKQYPFRLHIVGHGNHAFIGPDLVNLMTINEFTDLLSQTFASFNRKSPMHIIFHTCNSAYCDINPNMSQDSIKATLLEESLIGQFAATMLSLGFTQLTVTGYRGFYSHLHSHKASIVTSDTYNKPLITLPASSAMFTITPAQTVILPSGQGAYFPVDIKSDVLQFLINSPKP